MTYLRISDTDFFWIAVKTGKGNPKLLLSTYNEDAPAWDIVPVFERLAGWLGRKKSTTKFYDLWPLLTVFRSWLSATTEEAKAQAIRDMRVFGLRKFEFDEESDLVAYLLKHQPELLDNFEETNHKMSLVASRRKSKKS